MRVRVRVRAQVQAEVQRCRWPQVEQLLGPVARALAQPRSSQARIDSYYSSWRTVLPVGSATCWLESTSLLPLFPLVPLVMLNFGHCPT